MNKFKRLYITLVIITLILLIGSYYLYSLTKTSRQLDKNIKKTENKEPTTIINTEDLSINEPLPKVGF